jgi:queuine tRNA-ribosyltransferase
MTVALHISAVDGDARAGTAVTAAGRTFETPAFMPIRTRGAVRTLDNDDVRSAGADILLANTYHLMLRPGADVVAAADGLHRFAQ